MSTIKNGAAVLGLKVPLSAWLPDMTSMAADLYRRGETNHANTMLQLASTCVTALQLIDMLSARLALGNHEALGMPEPSENGGDHGVTNREVRSPRTA